MFRLVVEGLARRGIARMEPPAGRGIEGHKQAIEEDWA